MPGYESTLRAYNERGGKGFRLCRREGILVLCPTLAPGAHLPRAQVPGSAGERSPT